MSGAGGGAGDGTSAPPKPRCGRRPFIAALGVGQIVSWGTLYYSFPLLAGPMGQEFAMTRTEVYGAATVGLLVAGVAAYPVGAAIDRGHGRAVMAAGSALAALLLAAWSLLPSGGWLYPLFAGVGLAQAMTLYEPVFAVVARRYGAEARAGITALTLWGGFASTVFVPLIQLLLDHLDWRQTTAALAVINLALGLTLHLAVIDRGVDAPGPESRPVARGGKESADGKGAVARAVREPVFWGLLTAFTVYYGVFSALTFHLYPLLLERGYDAVTVVAAIALIGPAQVAGRFAVSLFAARQPIRVIGSVVVAGFPAALLLLWFSPPGFAGLAAFAVVYGAANGVMTIVRGLAVPEMLTRESYGAVNGVLAVPSIAAKAAAPVLAAVLWSAAGSYDAVLFAAFIGSLIVVVGFRAAAVYSGRSAAG